ncbi:MAG TPA: META domain-containing protein [Anaerolineae bacterium]|nr:META domain-containing protein [Anaerolineae bacterium]
MKRSVFILTALGVLALLLAACGGSEPEPTPTPPPPPTMPVEPTAVPQPTDTPQPEQPIILNFCEEVHPNQININTMGLPISWQSNCVPETPYDASQPPGPKGMPEHIEINFGVVNPADKQPGDPVIYIIPTGAYRAMWESNGDSAVSNAMDRIKEMISTQAEIPAGSNPVLPMEETGGVNDLAVQGEYINLGGVDYLCFVGRFGQLPNPVTNEGLRYICQGFACENDDVLISFFYPVTTPALPNSAADVPQEEMDKVDSDVNAYLAEQAAALDALTPADWNPNLLVLQTVLASLEYNDSYVPEPVPTVTYPTPEAGAPYGRVSAPSGVNIRTGPGSLYPVMGTAPFGTEGVIVGKSADGLWWVTPIDGAPNNQGWVSAAYVQAFNAENVPVIQAPPPPVPTATPTPLPTAVPSINFWADRTTINEGECTALRWDVKNIQAVWVYPQGANYLDFPVTGQGGQQVCPNTTTTYEMKVQKTDGSFETRQVTIAVNPGNPLGNTNWALTSMNGNQVPIPGSNITTFFANGGQLSGFGGCNNFNGSYSVSGNVISISALTSGQMSCGPELDGQEQAFLAALQSAQTFTINGNQLIIFDGGGQEALRFNRIG